MINDIDYIVTAGAMLVSAWHGLAIHFRPLPDTALNRVVVSMCLFTAALYMLGDLL